MCSKHRHPLRHWAAVFAFTAAATLAAGRGVTACDPGDPIVFDDAMGCGVTFQAFAGSKLDAVSVDGTVSFQGSASVKIAVPGPGDPSGGYAGGSFTTSEPRSLVAYNALSFWVKGSRAVSLEVAGIGNDNTGTSLFEARRNAIPITTSWMQVLVPIPLSTRLVSERGLFFFAEGPQGGAGLTIWVDEVQFVNTAVITNPRPALTTQTINVVVGTTVNLSGTRTVFAVNGIDQTVAHMPAYFDFTSSNPAVGEVSNGAFQLLASGTTTLTARLAAIDATGAITINATAPPPTAAPTPTLPAASVISLFSDAYANVLVNTWSASWDIADVADILVAGNPTKAYTNLSYAGIECTSYPIDATTMVTFHMDVWIPSGTTFRVKLVDFGANAVFGGGDDSQSELTFNATSTPPLATGAWVPLEIPIANFTGLAARAHIAQLILSGDTRTAFVDNVYFSNALVGVGEGAPVAFALQGVAPNPARHELRVRLGLPDAKPAALTLFDVGGRRLETRRVDGMGPGWQTVSLGVDQHLPAGVYLIRLTQDGRSLTTRAVLAR